jgi:hypothetical protein
VVVGSSGLIIVVEIDFWGYIVVSPDNWRRFVVGELLTLLIPVVVLLIRRWFISNHI